MTVIIRHFARLNYVVSASISFPFLLASPCLRSICMSNLRVQQPRIREYVQRDTIRSEVAQKLLTLKTISQPEIYLILNESRRKAKTVTLYRSRAVAILFQALSLAILSLSTQSVNFSYNSSSQLILYTQERNNTKSTKHHNRHQLCLVTQLQRVA